MRLGWRLRLPGFAGSISPAILAGTLVAAVLVAVALSAWSFWRRSAPATAAPVWACGVDTLSPRMQYTAMSFAEPLQRVFDDVLRPDVGVEVTHFAESQYLLEKVVYCARLVDAIEARLYTPVVRAVRSVADLVRRAHSGSVHFYLTYGLVGVLVVLVVAR